MRAGWIRFGPALSASVLERQEYSRAIELHFTVLYRYVQLRNLGDAQITQLTSGGFHGILCGILPGFRAGSDDLHYLIDRVCRFGLLSHGLSFGYLDRLSGPCYQRCTLPWCGRIVSVDVNGQFNHLCLIWARLASLVRGGRICNIREGLVETFNAYCRKARPIGDHWALPANY